MKRIVIGLDGSQKLVDLSPEEVAKMNEQPPIIPIEDWDGVLRGSREFMPKAKTTSNSNDFALLLSVLSTIRLVEYLELAMAGIRSGLSVDYTKKELTDLNQLFANCNIKVILK